MPIPSNILLFILLQICLSVYYYDDNGVVEGLSGYEGIAT